MRPGDNRAFEDPDRSGDRATGDGMVAIDRSRLQDILKEEERKSVAVHPKSRALFERAKKCLDGELTAFTAIPPATLKTGL